MINKIAKQICTYKRFNSIICDNNCLILTILGILGIIKKCCFFVSQKNILFDNKVIYKYRQKKFGRLAFRGCHRPWSMVENGR